MISTSLMGHYRLPSEKLQMILLIFWIYRGQIASIIQSFGEIFEEDFLIEQKAAMSSPGFIELISTKVVNPIIMLLYSIIFKVLGGKTPTADGKPATGLAGFAQTISNLFNDKADPT